MLQARIVSWTQTGAAAVMQAETLDKALEGMCLLACVKRDAGQNLVQVNSEFIVQFEDIDGLAIERCITQHQFEIIKVEEAADEEALKAA